MKILKNISYIIQTIIFIIIMLIGYILPFKASSCLGGALFKLIGKACYRLNNIAKINLQIAFPGIDIDKQHNITSTMWENLGRNLFEYFHLARINLMQNNNFEIQGLDNLHKFHALNKGGFLFSAHYGNWELGSLYAKQCGLKIFNVTRFINNPFLRYIINKIHLSITHGIIPKGSKGAKQIIQCLKNKSYISMLMDQKLNEGVAINFFNKPAMTASAISKLSLKFQVPILPFQVIRTKGTKLKIIYHPVIMPNNYTKYKHPEQKILTDINQHIENWINQNPQQWFWLHKRWEKEVYSK